MTDLFILYEHPEWFRPLFAVLDRRGVNYRAERAEGHGYNPLDLRPPAPVVLNRIAMSSFTRAEAHPIFYAISLFAHWETAGARIINGAEALAVDASKARQLSLIAAAGLDAPATIVVHRREDLVAAARRLRFPLLVKANIGGSGAGIERYDDLDMLAEAARTGTAPRGVDGVSLVQEYAPIEGGRITRLEVMDGRFLYAIDVEGAGATFDLCPADACLIQPGKPKISITEAKPDQRLIDGALTIAKAGKFDICGVEVFRDARDGTWRFYDVNGLSNFVASPLDVLGWDPHEVFVDYLERLIREQKTAR